MKVLAIIGTILGCIALLMGCYLQFSLVPAAEIAEANWELANGALADAYFGSLQHQLDMATMEAKTDFGATVMIAGLIAFLTSIVPAIKKQNIAWVGVGLGLVIFFLGAAHGTHMFS